MFPMIYLCCREILSPDFPSGQFQKKRETTASKIETHDKVVFSASFQSVALGGKFLPSENEPARNSIAAWTPPA